MQGGVGLRIDSHVLVSADSLVVDLKIRVVKPKLLCRLKIAACVIIVVHRLVVVERKVKKNED